MEKIKLKDLTPDSIDGIATLSRLMGEKVFLLKDTGVDSKIFQVWKAKGLVAFIEKGKWARLNLVGYLWIRVLETMRKFGCSVKLMKAIYNDLFIKAFKDGLADKNLKERHDYYKNLSKIRPLTGDEQKIFESIQSLYDYPIQMTRFRNEVSYFSQLVQGCLTNMVDGGIIIFEDGTFEKFLLPPAHIREELVRPIDISRPHLYIQLSSYIMEFLADEDKQSFLLSSGLLSEDEHRVIKEIRNKNVKSITVTFNDKEHKVEKIESDKKGLIKGEDAKKIMKLLGIKNYSAIELSTRDGKTLSFVHTEKKFF